MAENPKSHRKDVRRIIRNSALGLVITAISFLSTNRLSPTEASLLAQQPIVAFFDRNQDGRRNFGEQGMSNVEICVSQPPINWLGRICKRTDSTGNAVFNLVPREPFAAEVTVPSGHKPTTDVGFESEVGGDWLWFGLFSYLSYLPSVSK